VSYTKRNPELDALVHRREYIGEMVRNDGLGKIIRMASDPNRAHGYNPSTVATDELHAWTTPTLRRAWGAFASGGGARQSTQNLFISTAGDALERDDSILGQMLNMNEGRGEVEREPGLTISRNHAARTLIYNYSAPTSDRHDVEALKLANPASWITVDYLREQAESPALSDAEVLQLHGCVWSSGAERFIDPVQWEDGNEKVEIPAGSDIYVGIDMSLSDDCAAVAWAWPRGDGEIVLEAKVWAARPDVVADVYVEGGEIDPRDVEEFITDHLAKRYRVREIAYDPALFSRSAYELKDKGFTVAPVAQQSSLMAEAWKTIKNAVANATLRHHPNQKSLTSHCCAAVAEMTDRGWRVRKSKNSRKIDALVAGAVAHWRAAVAGSKPSVYEKRGLLEFSFGGDEDDDEDEL
jgi:phage terminase large subunit-like protein